MFVKIIEEDTDQKFEIALEKELSELSERNSKFDVKFSTCVTKNGKLYSALVIAN